MYACVCDTHRNCMSYYMCITTCESVHLKVYVCKHVVMYMSMFCMLAVIQWALAASDVNTWLYTFIFCMLAVVLWALAASDVNTWMVSSISVSSVSSLYSALYLSSSSCSSCVYGRLAYQDTGDERKL